MAPPVSSDTEDTDVVRHSAGKKKKKKHHHLLLASEKCSFCYIYWNVTVLKGWLDKLKSNGEQ